MCGKDFMAIRAKEDYFRYHNVPLESLHLPNKSCRPERTVIGGELYYMAKISKDDYQICGGKPLMVRLEHEERCMPSAIWEYQSTRVLIHPCQVFLFLLNPFFSFYRKRIASLIP